MWKLEARVDDFHINDEFGEGSDVSCWARDVLPREHLAPPLKHPQLRARRRFDALVFDDEAGDVVCP